MVSKIKEMPEFNPNSNIKYLLHWMSERHRIFELKSQGAKAPFTNDPILSRYKFTNVYRFLDWESQYLIQNVIGDDDRSKDDTVFRVLLFKMFNLSSVWARLEKELGGINTWTSADDIESVLISINNEGGKIFSNAYYISTPINISPEVTKYRQNGGVSLIGYALSLFDRLLNDNIMDRAMESDSFEELCNVFMSINGIGGFLAYQFAQDLNYSKHFNHNVNEIVIEGPGSIRGVQRCFDGVKVKDVSAAIKWTYDNLDELFSEYLPDAPKITFNGHRPQLPDIQNCFCETDKYIRGLEAMNGATGKSIKQTYKPTGRKLELFKAPPKWGIEPLICK